MKFAHIADCHIGAWRDQKLRDANLKAFEKTIDICLEKNIDFLLISGDLFNTALPAIDGLKQVTDRLRQLKESNIPVYAIAGSHDFSPSGKTMLDVLEKAGLIINVAKGEQINEKLKLNFTIDKKTGAKITGMLGKKGGLDKEYYQNLIKDQLEAEQGYKIFMLHSTLTEFKPKELEHADSHPLSLLPKNFNYYAAGHVHYVFQKNEPGYGLIAFPGPLFPNNFKEIEDLQNGGFYIVEDNKIEFQPVIIHNVFSISIDCNHKTPEQIEEEIKKQIQDKEFFDTIITIRLEGTLSTGKPSDINFKKIFEILYDKSAYFVMKNTSKLKSKEMENIQIQKSTVEDIEDSLIKEHLQKINVNLSAEKEEILTKQLIQALNTSKQEGEKNYDFEKRLKQTVNNLLEL